MVVNDLELIVLTIFQYSLLFLLLTLLVSVEKMYAWNELRTP